MSNKIEGKTKGLKLLQGNSFNPDAEAAVQEVAAQIGGQQSSLCLAFFSDEYDRELLARSLSRYLPEPVIGCTSTGQLSNLGFQRGGISGASLVCDQFTAIPYLIHPLSSLPEQIGKIAADVQERIRQYNCNAFGLLLVDGLSTREEAVTAALYRFLGDVPIVGGSAGDMLRFRETFVYYQGELLQDAAVFTLCLTSLPFYAFKHQHFIPTTTRLVVTEADTEKRLVREINGEPAAVAYARLVGTPVEDLNAAIFSRYPLMLHVKNDYYVRSIADMEPDGSLRFYCAINSGLVLTIGTGNSIEASFEKQLAKVREEIGEPSVIIGCDCILRRLELEALGTDEDFGRILAENRVIGFSTYGEQFNSLHVNQTFTGVAIGGW